MVYVYIHICMYGGTCVIIAAACHAYVMWEELGHSNFFIHVSHFKVVANGNWH